MASFLLSHLGMNQPADALSRRIAADPETKRIAEALGLSVADYVKLVVEFASTERSPQLLVADEQALKAAGEPVLTTSQLKQLFAEAEAVERRVGSAFEAPAPRKLVTF